MARPAPARSRTTLFERRLAPIETDARSLAARPLTHAPAAPALRARASPHTAANAAEPPARLSQAPQDRSFHVFPLGHRRRQRGSSPTSPARHSFSTHFQLQLRPSRSAHFIAARRSHHPPTHASLRRRLAGLLCRQRRHRTCERVDTLSTNTTSETRTTSETLPTFHHHHLRPSQPPPTATARHRHSSGTPRKSCRVPVPTVSCT